MKRKEEEHEIVEPPTSNHTHNIYIDLQRERRQSLTVSGLFKSSKRRAPQRPPSLDADEFLNLLHGSDPVKVELNWLENEVRGEEQELI
ncbi:Microtubule-associated protein 70-1 [Camellia lanceoleosa]|uniref:Microtubule-associated protein 70-1 n=1 Tax=Camellia lanceoleosa TaxID=1840588 RepID=A0ACC0GQK2_9ERIC|nr:Microtubule-associated protein 70-1 [Camellia lanceoleosa]